LLGFFGLSFGLQPWWCYSHVYLLSFKFLFLLGFFGLSFALQPWWCYSQAYLLSFKFLLRHEQDGNGNYSWKMTFWLVLKLEISYRVIISWRILVSFRGFFFVKMNRFLYGEIFEFL
jgi:hypothetical protein